MQPLRRSSALLGLLHYSSPFLGLVVLPGDALADAGGEIGFLPTWIEIMSTGEAQLGYISAVVLMPLGPLEV